MQRDLFFEDFTVGWTFRTAGATLSEAQILDFALQWDPQPFHIDRIAAERGPYGGLIASGFQTLLVAFRLIWGERIINVASMGSPGMDEIRWLRPVRPGDSLYVSGEVLDARESRSRSDRGFVTIRYTVVNQNDEPVMRFTVTHMLRRRASGVSSAEDR